MNSRSKPNSKIENAINDDENRAENRELMEIHIYADEEGQSGFMMKFSPEWSVFRPHGEGETAIDVRRYKTDREKIIALQHTYNSLSSAIFAAFQVIGPLMAMQKHMEDNYPIRKGTGILDFESARDETDQ